MNTLNTFGLLSSLYITLFGALFLLAASSNQYKNRYFLSLFFFNGFVLFLGHTLTFFECWRALKYLEFAFMVSLLMFYPFYFRYLNSAFGYRISSLRWRYHFAPGILFGVIVLAVTYGSTWDAYKEYMNFNFYGTPLHSLSSKILFYLYKGARSVHIIQILFYNIVSFVYILGSRRSIQNSFSNLDKFQLQYFYIVNAVFLIFMAIPGIYVTIVGRIPFAESGYLLGLVTFLFTFLYLILGMVGLRQKAFTETELQQNEGLHVATVSTEKGKSLNKEELYKYFEVQAPWRNSNLNIWDVSVALATNRTYVSKLINKEFHCNFNAFVNDYRITEAKKLFLDGKHASDSLDNIAEMVGFGSTSSFVRVFKNMTGTTPAKFKEQNNS